MRNGRFSGVAEISRLIGGVVKCNGTGTAGASGPATGASGPGPVKLYQAVNQPRNLGYPTKSTIAHLLAFISLQSIRKVKSIMEFIRIPEIEAGFSRSNIDFWQKR